VINFFGYFKETNHIGLSSVGFDKAAIFLRNRDFCILELFGFKYGDEVNLLRENEKPVWVTNQHYLSISDLLETEFTTPISYAKIELADGGEIHYSAAQLFVKYPIGEDLKTKTVQLLETMGYYAAKEILQFCENNPDMHLLTFVLGMEPTDITDEFERMKKHTEQLDGYDE